MRCQRLTLDKCENQTYKFFEDYDFESTSNDNIKITLQDKQYKDVCKKAYI
jgi:hypothetical protein